MLDSSMPVLKFATKKLIDLKMNKQNDERTKKSKDHISIALKLKPDNINREQKTKCKKKSISFMSTRVQAVPNLISIEIEPYLSDITKYLLNCKSTPQNTAVTSNNFSPSQLQYQSGKLIIIHAAMMLKQQTLHLALAYFNEYVKKSATQHDLGLIGITCLWIASKYQEIYPPRLKYYANFSYQSINDIITMENKILTELNFILVKPTAYSYLQMLCPSKSDEFTMSNYILHCCFSRLFTQNIDSALLALSVFKLATHILKKNHTKTEMEKLAQYSKQDFTDCFKQVCSSIASETSKSKVMKKKFGEGNVLKVANFCTFMK